jgi:hypothetical protein
MLAMSADAHQKPTEFLELANNYPSPHNGQPMMLESGPEGSLELYFDTSRGLTATPISYLFSFVSIGVFVRHLEYCAEALGHKLVVHLDLPKQAAMAGPGKLHCARLFIDYGVNKPDVELAAVLRRRQTSRKKYKSGLSQTEQQTAHAIADAYNLDLEFLDDRQAQQAIWLNQRAVFDDMFDEPVRRELDHWLRYSAEEKHAKRDGLAYDCMELSGRALHFAVRHYRILHWPIIAPLLRQYYLRTMKDASSVGYLAAPFQTEEQSYEIGRCVIELWVELTRHGEYLHPFGTIVSNDRAHGDFVRLVGLEHESRDSNYVVFIFRAGASDIPVESDRIAVSNHLFSGGTS